jgi:hypothetical protein
MNKFLPSILGFFIGLIIANLPGILSPSGEEARSTCQGYEAVAQVGVKTCLESHERTKKILAEVKRNYNDCTNLLELQIPNND